MSDGVVLVGRGREIGRRSEESWRQDLAAALPRIRSRLDFMDPADHRIRYLVVRELAGGSGPVTPEAIAGELSLDVDDVVRRLARLEERLFFLVRDREGNVSWAFPVTAEQTAHRVDLGGERPTWGA